MQIMECITVNMTCVYAMLAYSSIKQKDFSNVYVSKDGVINSNF